MGSHRSRRPTSSDSGYDTNSDGPSSPQQERTTPPSAREQAKSAISAGAPRVSLSDARRTDLTASIGTQLSGIQLSSLDAQQLDQLALLVSERGVVFLREQDLSAEEQSRIFDHYVGVASVGKQIVERRAESVIVKNSPSDYGEKFTFAPDSGKEWVSDGSFEVAPPSYSLFRAEEAGGEAVWVSQYGLYDNLSKHVQAFVDNLEAVHSSQLQYSSIISLRGMPSNRAPVSTTHPLVRTHPVTGLKALTYTPGAVSHIAELTRHESANLINLLERQINAADEHSVRVRWEEGTVALWDNRCTARKEVYGLSGRATRGVEVRVGGEKPFFSTASTSRTQHIARLASEAEQSRIRAEEIKKRYNNTPLRRILQRQRSLRPQDVPREVSAANREVEAARPTTPSKSESSQTGKAVKESDVLREVEKSSQGIVRKAAGPHVQQDDDAELSVRKTREPKTQTPTPSQDAAPPQTRVLVSSKGSPLRRIIQRQVSGTGNGLGAGSRVRQP
ncbi:TauD-domain-containing protein [Pyrenochaeta sp. DS3sAY3a]|nr:TauD-domain-containing protein [Pyrenochaeta sp. DS3sAY3a]